MSRYIEFTTSPDNPHVKASGGAVHNGEIPTRRITPKAIRIDGEPVTFKDESLHEKLHHAIIVGEKLRARLAIIDCLAFIALMQGSSLGKPNRNGLFPLHPISEPRHILSDDIENDLPVNIGNSYHNNQVRYVHSLYPAHLPDHALYIQKLGDNEPISLSTLDQAHFMRSTTIAHPMPELRIGR
jgi:hypothetical protein